MRIPSLLTRLFGFLATLAALYSGWLSRLLRFFPGRVLKERLPARALWHRLTARYSLRTRLALTMAGLAVASCLVFGLCSYVTYEMTLSHIVRWHMEPILRLLLQERQAGKSPEKLHELAQSLRVSWFDDETIPEELRPAPGTQELTRIDTDIYAFVSADKTREHVHAVVGRVKDLDDIEEVMLTVALACGCVSLVAALLLSCWLSKRLVTPLVRLTGTIHSGETLESSPLCRRKDEVGELSRAFVARERSLRDFLNREQLFTGDVSHELRTPLTVLQGATEILETRLADTPLKPVVSRMQRTLDGMTDTVHTMLVLARRPEQLHYHAFDLSALIRREEDFVATMLRNRPITFALELPDTCMIHGNPDLSALVVHNLLDNACRYTQEGRIVLHLDRDGFAVTDTAPPIDEEVRARMFERGVRGMSATPGSGLGLSLVQRGCERLGWTVRHETWAQGNRFVVRFGQGEPEEKDQPRLSG